MLYEVITAIKANMSECTVSPFDSKMMLFTTKSCPNCPAAKDILKDVVNLEHVDAHQNIDLVQKYKIRSAPTLIVDNGNEYIAYAGITGIQQYMSKLNL